MQVEGLRLPPAPRRVRVFAAPDLHVTLGFLGSVQEAEARAAWSIVEEAAGLRRVEGTFSRVKPLGHPRKPSALSALVDRGVDALTDMTLALRAPLLEAAGAPPDDRAPLPHMTIARIQRRAQSAERRDALHWAEQIGLEGVTFVAGSLALYTWASDRQERLFRIVAEHTV